MEKILNLTQHAATPEQIDQGVFEPALKEEVAALLTFNELPEADEIHRRSQKLAEIAEDHAAGKAMIGGALFMMSALESALLSRDITPVYSFSRRVSSEVTDPVTNEVRKTQTFRHLGFVAVENPWNKVLPGPNKS